MWVDVTFLGSLPSEYTYRVPLADEEKVCVGGLVVAPLRKRRLTGVVTQVLNTLPDTLKEKALKPVLFVPFDTPVFSEEVLRFYAWCAKYYQIPLGGILRTALPLPHGILKGETVLVTPEGEKNLGSLTPTEGPPTAAFRDLLKQPLELSRLIGQKGGWRNLLTWTERGWIQWNYPGFEKRFESRATYYSLAPEMTEGMRTGPKEKKILAFVANKGLISAPELKNRFPRAHGSIKRLLGKNALRVTYQSEPPSLPSCFNGEEASPVMLSHEQEVVLLSIKQELAAETPRPILLHGVTGGGKTELYIRAIQGATQEGKSSLVLVPEIVLTPQLISRVRKRCRIPIVVWHSRLTGKERWHQWLLLHRVAPVVVIGARSAIFTPVKDLGLIIIDEEHDPSFKQEEGLLYNAKDVAVVRSRHQSCALILGSATPSIESYHNVKKGRFRYSVITRRPTGQPLPVAEVVDLREEGVPRRQATQGLMLSRPLREALLKTHAEGQQALLFLNRRGYARVVTCVQCGQTLSCPHCNVSLTLHRPTRVLRCHYCGYSRALPETCEVCGGTLLQMGGGTQRLEEEIQGMVPGARVARLDRDTMQKRSEYEALLTRLRQRKIDILIGTQMIVKGHDYPGVVLMGVVMADHSLKFPDFRASERTFQLLTQASGRCGRGNIPGRVIIQTFSPGHYSIRHATHHDFIGFYEEEIRYRQELGYPPFTRLAVLRISGPDLEIVTRRAGDIVSEGRHILRRHRIPVDILGPAPALLSRLKNRYRWQILLKGKNSGDLHRVVEAILRRTAAKPGRGIRIQVEFDPIQLV